MKRTAWLLFSTWENCAAHGATTKQQQSGKLALLELTCKLVLYLQHLEGWLCLSMFFMGLEGLSQKSWLTNHGEDKERPVQGRPLPISPWFHRQVTPSNNAYKEFWRRLTSSDISRFPGHPQCLCLSFLCYMFSNMTNNKGLVGTSGFRGLRIFLIWLGFYGDTFI